MARSLLLAAFVLLFAGEASPQSRQPPQPPAAQREGEAEQEQRGTADTPLVVEIARAPEVEPETREQRRSRDTQAWLAFAQVVLGAFTLAGLWYARKSALAAKESADVAKKALEGLERPYLYVVPAGGGIGAGQSGSPGYGSEIVAICPLRLTNHGRSPALVTRVHSRGAVTGDPSVAAAVTEPVASDVSWLIADRSEDKPWEFRVKGSSAEWDSLINGRGEEAKMIIVLTIQYEAVYGARFERGVCWQYRGRSWVEAGGRAFNYDKRIEGDE